MKRKTSGTSDEVTMDLGNPKLHERHEVVLQKEDGEVVPKARVTDQLEIDRLLLGNKITSLEHKAGEFMLQVFVDAGVFVKTVNLNAISSGRFPKSNYHYGLLRFRDTARVVQEVVDDDQALKIFDCLAKDYPIEEDDLIFFRLAMQAIDQKFLSGS